MDIDGHITIYASVDVYIYSLHITFCSSLAFHFRSDSVDFFIQEYPLIIWNDLLPFKPSHIGVLGWRIYVRELVTKFNDVLSL